jgi:hypothetical protein
MSNSKNFNQNEVEFLIELIKSVDITESYSSYTFIRNLFNNLNFPIPKCIIPKGMKLLRARVHKNNEKFFNCISEISYNSQPLIIKDFGRANEPCQSIFYCSDNQNVSFVETCTIAREDLDKDSELITWGVWEVVKDIEISYIIGCNTDKNKNETLKNLTDCFTEFLRNMPIQIQETLPLFLNFVSDQFKIEAKGHHSLYKISCAYSNWVYGKTLIDNDNNFNENTGVMYCSSIWPDEGMNIALKSNIVDSSLRLIDVRRDNIVRNGNDYFGSETITAKSINIEMNTIFWE